MKRLLPNSATKIFTGFLYGSLDGGGIRQLSVTQYRHYGQRFLKLL